MPMLLFTGGPAAITRCVVAMAIDTVNRIGPSRSGSHVLQKSHERQLPAATDANTTASVPTPTIIASTLASMLHRDPGVIGGCMGPAMDKPDKATFRPLFSNAAAALHHSRANAINASFPSASATATEDRVIVGVDAPCPSNQRDLCHGKMVA